MRSAIFSINMSLDGCYDHTAFSGGADMMEFFTDQLKEADLIIFGRKMYELMIPFWPEVARQKKGTALEIEFAETMTALPKIVFSRTLDTVEGDATLMRENPVEVLRELKQRPGGKISIDGVNLAGQLIAAGLVDEICIVVHPIIVGKGPHLFNTLGISEKTDLALIESKTLSSGAVALSYSAVS